MEMSVHSLNNLFDQLGLASADADIDRFIDSYRPVPPTMPLAEAPFWTPSQASFIRQALELDADWSEAVDQLDTRLRLS